jgi:GST-like protein
MIRFYFNAAPNPAKVALFLEESGLPYELMPVDTRKAEQHAPAFRAINPNGKVPAIVDTDGPGGATVRVFDSTAILLYLGEKTGQFMGTPADRPELLSWLMFIASGIGPYSGQAVHFQRAAPEPLAYAINRYRREAARHYQVLEDTLAQRTYIVGDAYTIADMSAWGWLQLANIVLPGSDDPLAGFTHIKRWLAVINARPAVERSRIARTSHPFKTEMDETALRAMFPSNYPPAAA